ncbi:MATE efflux family protein [Treponema brennaborense DSM 12168]|uniref:Multidrug-efflux transporter n=2 Tax=Treponema TaxID=157 RepID=F4LQH5_TREBD|nr:MATE efflux family protein [Treponema brennaborense DSM 12168]
MQNQIQENKMGVMPVNKLIITMSVPMMVSMLVTALYNVVDSIFVSMIGEYALTAVSLAFPIQNLMIAIATGTGVGINALLSMNLGRKDFDAVNRTASNGVFLAVCSYVLFLLFGLFFVRVYFESQTDIPEIIEFGCDYMKICAIFCFGLFGQITFDRLLQSTGKTLYTMFTQGLGAVVNIILDPIMIFGLFGFPAMGVAGAAVATVIGQIAGMFMSIIFNLKKNHEITFAFRSFRPNLQTIRGIYSVGFPSIIMVSIASVMTFGMNIILMAFSSTAVAVFGVYFKLQSFVFMPVFGLNNGMIPIISYNFGARNRHRIMKTVKLCVIYAMGMMIVGFALFHLCTGFLLSMFNASPEMTAIGIPALRIISISFLFAGFCIICGSVFQALGNGVLSLIVSVARQLVVLLPIAWLLSRTGDISAVWWSFPIAEIASLICSTVFLRYIYKKEVKPLPAGAD